MSKHDASLSKAQLDLLKQFKKQISTAASQPMQQSNPAHKHAMSGSAQIDSQDDQQLFARAMLGVEKLDHGNLLPPQKSKLKPLDAQTLARRVAAQGTTAPEDTVLSDTQAVLHPVASQAFLSYRIATLQHRVFDDLKHGKLRWFEAVDLHGCTVEQARQAVLDIIQMAKQANENVIKIVHGKGPDGILKTYVNGWLRQHRDILAFVSAPDNQGGTGAVFVLLKRAEKKVRPQSE